MEKTFNFEEASTELLRTYKKLILKKDPTYKYNGPLLTSMHLLKALPNLDESLSLEEFEYRKGKGLKPIECFIAATLQLGIEQGLRMAYENNTSK